MRRESLALAPLRVARLRREVAVQELRPFDQIVSDLERPTARTGPWRTKLRRILEAEVLPHLSAYAAVADTPPRAVSALHGPTISALVDAVLAGPDGGLEQIEALRRRRVPLDLIFLEILTPAARRLGELWENDERDFVDVSIALCRLRQIFEVLRPVDGEAPVGGLARRALLALAPGETHTFGLSIVAQFFTASRWQVKQCDDGMFEAKLEAEWFDVLGFSLSCIRFLEPLKAAIAAARSASRNKALGVIVGGQLFIDQPGLARIIGADGTGVDGPSAVRTAKSLLTTQRPM